MAIAATIMATAFAVPAMAGPDGTFLSRINNSRANAGLAPVEMYWDLTDDARAHTDRMISTGSIYHNAALSSVTGVWQKLGENVGVGADANSLHDAFMASSSHRANILGDFNYVGIGSKIDESGILWVTVVFMKAAPGLNGGGETTTTTNPPPEPIIEVKPTPEATPTAVQGSSAPTPKSTFSSVAKTAVTENVTAYGRLHGPIAV